ncbi:DUF4304 domain-containing protein [Metabacillus idriensis]|uniref:DUF4304 domain-containing protein n=1 Tax=Metabacillus idriensis TaxID=324768 RepID=UPI00203AFCB2|nr:DUF4304 domain-containing protein [Metabacillus idriensis]MCM3597223.1 DUF4304 domain-containing protein [Metabacillus idriensis]
MSSTKRKLMIIGIRNVVQPLLKAEGFKGSIPNFRRSNEASIDLITFQFNRWGGSFVVELASCPRQGIFTSWGEQIPPNKVTAHHMDNRFRLGATSQEEDGIWFNFEEAESQEDFEKVASEVLNLLDVADRDWISNLLK